MAGAEHLRAPATIGRGDDGSVLVGDAAGTVWLPPDLARERVERRYDPAARDDRYAPGIVATAGEGEFVAATGAVLTRVGRRATTALAALPGARRIRAIDAARDGWWWATDGRGLWRARGDDGLRAAWAPPLQGEEPAAMAVRDGRVLVAGAGGAVAVRDGATGAWRDLTLPEGMGRPVAAHVDERGGLFVLTTSGLAVSDAMRFVAVPAPSVPVGVPARIATLGDRWLIASVAAYVSDDRGGRWDARFGQAYERPLGVHPREDASLEVALAYAFARDAVMVVDATRALSRSDALGARFERVATLPVEGEGGGPSSPRRSSRGTGARGWPCSPGEGRTSRGTGGRASRRRRRPSSRAGRPGSTARWSRRARSRTFCLWLVAATFASRSSSRPRPAGRPNRRRASTSGRSSRRTATMCGWSTRPSRSAAPHCRAWCGPWPARRADPARVSPWHIATQGGVRMPVFSAWPRPC